MSTTDKRFLVRIVLAAIALALGMAAGRHYGRRNAVPPAQGAGGAAGQAALVRPGTAPLPAATARPTSL